MTVPPPEDRSARRRRELAELSAGGLGPRLADPASIPELVAVLDAVRRGTKLSRFVRLTVVCTKQHTLARVVQTAAGPVLLAESRGVLGAIRLDDARLAAGGDKGTILVQCKCSAAPLWGPWVRWKLASGARRVKWPG